MGEKTKQHSTISLQRIPSLTLGKETTARRGQFAGPAPGPLQRKWNFTKVLQKTTAYSIPGPAVKHLVNSSENLHLKVRHKAQQTW